ncbi:hypothetical protein LINGRAHAP2_LOCUS18505, partial [Linum grandiflorum]
DKRTQTTNTSIRCFSSKSSCAGIGKCSSSISYIYREGNCLADYLASRRHGLPLGTHSVNVSDPAVATWIIYDRLRSSQPRLVLC